MLGIWTFLGRIVLAQDKDPLTFTCDLNSDLASTIAINSQGQKQKVFNWSHESANTIFFAGKDPYRSPKVLCEEISNKLNKLAESSEISYLVFIPTELFGLPTICVSTNQSRQNCIKVLFAISPGTTNQPHKIAEEILDLIVDLKITRINQYCHKGKQHQYLKKPFYCRGSSITPRYEFDISDLFE